MRARFRGQRRREFLGPLAAGGVDDSRPGRLAQHPQQLLVFPPVAARSLHLVEEVRPGEAGDERSRLAEVQLLDDVAADRVGGRGSQGDRSGVAQLAAEMAQPGVVRPEIVAPLADAVGFVHRQQL